MGTVTSQLGVWLVLLYGTGVTVAATGRLVTAAGAVRAAWDGEAAVRRCAWVGAAAANLRDAAGALAAADPDHTATLAAAADDLASRLAAWYPGTGADVESCPGRSGLAAILHLERHPGQPAPWPNWVPRLTASGGS